jgi:hypothetical protein
MIQWRWKYFTRDELACKGSNSFVINEDALDKLEKMREIMGAPLKINSAYRSPSYNKKIGGAKNSMHVQGRAFDVSIKGHNPSTLYTAALHAGFTGFGFYRTFLHVDTSNKRSWGGYAKQYTHNISNPPKALSTEKETESPNKIEGVALRDKQKTTVAVTTGVAATGSIATIITDPQILTPALSFLQNVDYRVGLAVCAIIALTGLGYWLWRRR